MKILIKIDKSFITKMLAASKEYSSLEGAISSRITDIIKYISQPNAWWVYGVNSEEDGDCADSFVDDIIQVTGDWKSKPFIDKDGNEWHCSSDQCIPARWLHEDFEAEYDNGVILYEEKEKEKKLKTKDRAKQRKLEKQALIEAASKKLTKEERKALGIPRSK